jgi:hypothetical protein
LHVYAFSADDTRTYPELLNRRADEDASKKCGERIGDDDGDEAAAPGLEAAGWEDALVLEEDGEFGEADGEAVGRDADVYALRLVRGVCVGARMEKVEHTSKKLSTSWTRTLDSWFPRPYWIWRNVQIVVARVQN